MKILYDHQIFYRQNYGGVSRYFCELMNQFSTDPDIRFTLPLRFAQNDNLARFPQLNKYWSGRYNRLYDNDFVSILEKKIRFNTVNFGLNYIINNKAESVRLLKIQDFDIFHPTYYEPYFLKYLQKKPFVLTVYDMIHELFPEYFRPADKTRAWKKELIGNAGVVLAISENTKKDIIKFTGIDQDRVRVIHLGNPFEHSYEPARINISSDPPVVGRPYLLFVGGRSAYKNFNFFIESVAGLLRENEELEVVCAGSSPFSDREKKFLRNLQILHKVHSVRINEEILKNLYKNARAFVFPSLYEGFGLPVLEAFSCGCPVLLTNSSSLPEVGGDAALYFTPGDKESLNRGISTILFDRKCRDDLIKKGSERLKLFSWEKTAGATKKVYHDLLYR